MAGGGFYEFDYTLIVDQIISPDEAVIAMYNDSTGVIDGSFSIKNDNGIKIVNNIPDDGNFYTSGNSSQVIFYNLFLNPGPGNLDFYTSIQSELFDNETHNIDYLISCFNKVDLLQTLICYPNPTTEVLFFEESGTLTLFNSKGQILLKTKANNFLDVRDYKRGLYFVHLRTKKSLFTAKLVLR